MSPHHQHIVFEHWFRRLYPMCPQPPSEVQQVLEIYTEKQSQELRKAFKSQPPRGQSNNVQGFQERGPVAGGRRPLNKKQQTCLAGDDAQKPFCMGRRQWRQPLNK